MMHLGQNQTAWYSRKLPCGCEMHRSVSGPCAAPQDLAEYWFADRLPRHRCELVSPANPNGLMPRARNTHEARPTGGTAA